MEEVIFDQIYQFSFSGGVFLVDLYIKMKNVERVANLALAGLPFFFTFMFNCTNGHLKFFIEVLIRIFG